MQKLLMAVPALLALAALPAKADTMFLANTATVIGGQNVTILSPKFENVQAGQIQLTGPAGSVYVWCLDVFDPISLPYDYTVSTFTAGDIKPGIASLSTGQVRQIADLMWLGNNVGGIDKAAIQVAIWKAEYGGLFSSTASGTLLSDENTYLSQTSIGGIHDRTDLVLTTYTDAVSNPSQAFGTVTVLAAVPEISTWFMMILGFAGIGLAGMRKARGSFRWA